MLVVDILHEFLLGVWKLLITILIRLLYAINEAGVAEFNMRYFVYCMMSFCWTLNLVPKIP